MRKTSGFTPLNVLSANRLQRMSYNKLVTAAQQLHDEMLLNVATFATPPVDLGDFQDQIDAFKVAIQDWGIKGARGSHQDRVTTTQARELVQASFLSNVGYAVEISNADSTQSFLTKLQTLLSAGIREKSHNTRQSAPQQPRNMRILAKANQLGTGFSDLRWKRPGTSPKGSASKPNFYEVWAINQMNQAETMIGTTTSTSFTVENSGNTIGFVQPSFYVVAVNTAGRSPKSNTVCPLSDI